MTDFIMVVIFIALFKYIVDSLMLLKPPALEFAGASFDEIESEVKDNELKPWEITAYFKKGDVEMPEPDPAIGQAALDNIEIGKEMQAFAETQYADQVERQEKLDAITQTVVDSHLETQKQASDWATADRNRYEETFQPLEDEFVKTANEYDTPEKRAEAAAMAKAGVMDEAEKAKAQTNRSMASYGIKPGSGRHTGISKATEVATALGSADAKNKARELVESKGLALKSQAINVGRNLPSQALSASGLGLSAGSSATGTQSNTQNMAYNAGNVMNAGFSGNMNGNSSGANILGSQYNQQMSAYNADQAASGAFWGGIGSAAGTLAGAAIVSSKDFKENKQPIDGEALEAVKGLPVESWNYKDGIADGGEHIGPYAEDFKAVTGKGDGKSIPMQDMMGLQLKAIQELGIKVEKLESGKKGKRKPAVLEGEFKEVASA